MPPVGVEIDPEVTVRVAVPPIEPKAAEMYAEPGATPIARPPLLMVATMVADDVQTTELVRSRVLLSL
jgi:hypothetical protein